MKIEKLLNEIALLRMLCGKRIRGQVLVFYALMMPIFLLCCGVAIDLGWYYLNVSRLQNAADAAVLAGAYKLVEQEEFNYIVKVLRDPPNDLTEYNKVRFNTKVEDLNMLPSQEEAERYSGKNLGHVVEGESMTIFDDWSTAADVDLRKVSLKAALYAKLADAQWGENGIKYYGVTLEEKVAHLFLRNFEPMEAIVTSYVMLRPHDVDLITVIKELEDTTVIANWEYQKTYKDTSVKWNHYRQTVNDKKAVSYVAGEYFRTETVNVEVQPQSNSSNNGFKSGNANHSSGQSTSANGWKYYDEMTVDSLNIDFNQDLSNNISKKNVDWDLGADLPTGINKVSYIGDAMNGWTDKKGDLRIQGLINFRDAWKNRNLMDDDTDNDLIPDPLWVRIESDPWWIGSAAPYIDSGTGLNSVRQMIISIDKSNVESTDHAFKFTDDKKKVDNKTKQALGDFDGYEIEGGLAYKYRPFFVFYKGPEVYDESNTVRKSQPVILNLNADWNGILYAPNSPVVILGNGKKLQGFVVAKEFVQLKTVKDYTDNGYSEYTGENGKPMLVESDKVFSESKLNEKYPETDYRVTKSDDGKTISVYKLERVPKYFIVDPHYVRGEANATEESYVEALKHYRNLTPDKIVQIKFENNGYNNTQSYSVAKDDLLEVDPDPVADPDPSIETPNIKSDITAAQDQYVKVITSDNEVRYIAKTNLPYVKTYRSSKYFYVPVCDIKEKKTATSHWEGYYAGVTIANDDDTDSYTATQQDKWKVFRNSLSGYEKYIAANITKTSEDLEIVESSTDENGTEITTTRTIKLKYFTIKSEETAVNNTPQTLVATYNKISDDAYISDKLTYYTYYDYHTNQDGIDIEDGNLQTVIRLVMDNKGNVQTKPLDEGSSEPITKDYKFQPNDKRFDAKTDDLETGERTKDYRLSEYEVLYHKSAFNLSADSCYSYFQIPSLHRINYEYMNVDELNQTSEKPGSSWDVEDMFFTTRRANWID